MTEPKEVWCKPKLVCQCVPNKFKIGDRVWVKGHEQYGTVTASPAPCKSPDCVNRP